MSDFLFPVRGLQRIYVKEFSFYVFVWCQDDVDIERDKRICCQICGSPSEFWPPSGQYILAQIGGAFNYVHGVPIGMESVNGAIKVHYSNLPSYSLPRQAYGEANPAAVPDTSGKSKGPQPGNYLEGSLVSEQLTLGRLVWAIKSYSGVHSSSPVILEVSDSEKIAPGIDYKYAAPMGSLIVEYERDSKGNIKADSNGAPKVKSIDDTKEESAQNKKIGYLALSFVENLFGNGVHGWVGTQQSTWPFKAVTSTYVGTGTPPSDQALRYRFLPGKVNHITPSNIDQEFTAPGSDGEYYAWLRADMASISNRVAAVSIETGSTVPETPEPSVAGQAPYASYRGITKITVKDGKILRLDPLVKDSQWIACIISGVDNSTGEFRLDLIWTSASDGTGL